jgi:hypothetical protein
MKMMEKVLKDSFEEQNFVLEHMNETIYIRWWDGPSVLSVEDCLMSKYCDKPLYNFFCLRTLSTEHLQNILDKINYNFHIKPRITVSMFNDTNGACLNFSKYGVFLRDVFLEKTRAIELKHTDRGFLTSLDMMQSPDKLKKADSTLRKTKEGLDELNAQLKKIRSRFEKRGLKEVSGNVYKVNFSGK